MPVYSEKFLLTQVGRSMAIHHDPPHGVRRKSTARHGLFSGVKGRMVVMRVCAPDREDEYVHVEQDADQPAFAVRDGYGGSVWWEWTSPQLPVPRDFKDE
jgi:hypothetical protein